MADHYIMIYRSALFSMTLNDLEWLANFSS